MGGDDEIGSFFLIQEVTSTDHFEEENANRPDVSWLGDSAPVENFWSGIVQLDGGIFVHFFLEDGEFGKFYLKIDKTLKNMVGNYKNAGLEAFTRFPLRIPSLMPFKANFIVSRPVQMIFGEFCKG